MKPGARGASSAPSCGSDRHRQRLLARSGTKYHTSADEEGAHSSPANRLGIRHIAFAVHDLDTIVNGLRDKGLDTIDEVENYEDAFRLCYVRGPEGLIAELAEQTGSEETA